LRLKSLLEVAGLRRRPQRFGYTLRTFALPEGETVTYAQWLHPGETPKAILAEHVDAFRRLVAPGDFCLDIGAHSGDTALPMALAAGPEGCVLALEPNPFVFHVLQKNARANRRLANIEPLMAAATPATGFVQFEYSDAGFCNGGSHDDISPLRHGHAYKLEVFGVDLAAELETDYADRLPRLRFVKVDAEGFDFAVLRSLAEVIGKQRPVVKTEVYKLTTTAHRRRMFGFFQERGYRIHRVEEEPLGTGRELDLDDVDRWRHYDILCLPGD
jgi:FkbM family methyltransferase